MRFLFLFVLTDAILLKLDLQKKAIGFGQSSKWKIVSLSKVHHISKNWERVFDFQYKVVTGQCVFETTNTYRMKPSYDTCYDKYCKYQP